MEKLEAVGTNVFLEMVPVEETKNGFVLTSTDSTTPRKGIILSVGEKVDPNSPLRKGKIALIKKDAGIEVNLSEFTQDGNTYKVVNEKDILIVY